MRARGNSSDYGRFFLRSGFVSRSARSEGTLRRAPLFLLAEASVCGAKLVPLRPPPRGKFQQPAPRHCEQSQSIARLRLRQRKIQSDPAQSAKRSSACVGVLLNVRHDGIKMYRGSISFFYFFLHRFFHHKNLLRCNDPTDTRASG